METVDRERIIGMVQELKRLLETYLPEASFIAEPHMKNALAIRKELEQMGFLVQWEGSMNPETLKFTVHVTLWEPRKDMDEKAKKLYNEWFCKRHGLAPLEQKPSD